MAHNTGTAGTDAQATNKSSRSTKQYKDLDLFFGRDTMGNDVNKVEDIQAVKRSVRNLVLLENMTPIAAVIIARKIEDVINNFEPRARLNSVRCYPNYNSNAYDVSVSFYVVNTPTELVELDVMLERLR